MTEPDDLYTMRAQFWLGHYAMALEEAKSVARRTMTPQMKQEREEFVLRSHLALGEYDKVIAGSQSAGADHPALQALGLRAALETSGHDEARRDQILEQLKALLASAASKDTVTPALQLLAAQTFLAAGQTKEALSCVHWGVSMEQIALSLQIYLKLDRLDLAQEQLSLLKQADEEAVLTQLAQVYLHIATGASTAQDAIHHLNSMSEQYGPSPLLLNLMACAYMVVGQYGLAETRLQECRTELASSGGNATPHAADTLINLIVCLQHQNKTNNDLVEDIKKTFPTHPYCQGLDRVVSAIDRESVKYRV